MDRRVAARLAIIGDERPPVPGLAGVSEVIAARFVVRMVSVIRTIGVNHQPGFVEERRRIVLERVDVRIKDAFEEL